MDYRIYQDEGSRISWIKVSMIVLGLIILAGIIIFFILDPLNMISKKSNDLLNQNQKTYDCTNDIYNCANFSTQAQAQDAYSYCAGLGVGDVYHLDADGNGKACESLP